MNTISMREGYKSIVSLGFFCGPSQELERIGYRSFSLPFDWLITEDFSVVLALIENNFDDFLNETNLVQEKDINPKYYFDSKLNLHFYHDFLPSGDFREQLPFVRQKYDRRIERFYKTISEPCLLLRYCHNKDEFIWICDHIERIKILLKSYNKFNDIVFVCNKEDVVGVNNKDVVKVFTVSRDENDVVCRRFIKYSKLIRRYIEKNVIISKRQRIANYYRYHYNQIKKKYKKLKTIIIKR